MNVCPLCSDKHTKSIFTDDGTWTYTATEPLICGALSNVLFSHLQWPCSREDHLYFLEPHDAWLFEAVWSNRLNDLQFKSLDQIWCVGSAASAIHEDFNGYHICQDHYKNAFMRLKQGKGRKEAGKCQRGRSVDYSSSWPHSWGHHSGLSNLIVESPDFNSRSPWTACKPCLSRMWASPMLPNTALIFPASDPPSTGSMEAFIAGAWPVTLDSSMLALREWQSELALCLSWKERHRFHAGFK